MCWQQKLIILILQPLLQTHFIKPGNKGYKACDKFAEPIIAPGISTVGVIL